MSGIYIPGMKMPTSCTDCPFRGFDRVGGRGNTCTLNESITLHAILDGLYVKFVRMGDCPLVPVPEHGDLIDRNETAKTLAHDYAYAAADMVRDEMPTIIPADKED